jgi:hypothetical protein
LIFSFILVTLFATDAALAWRAKKKSTTTQRSIKVDSNFTCEYDAEGLFPGSCYLKSELKKNECIHIRS